MDLRDSFEAWYCDQHNLTPEDVKDWRMGNGSYGLPGIASAFRCFRAGFEINPTEKFQVLGYLSNKGVLSARQSKGVFFNASQTDAKPVAVYIKQSNTHKTGENHEKQ